MYNNKFKRSLAVFSILLLALSVTVPAASSDQAPKPQVPSLTPQGASPQAQIYNLPHIATGRFSEGSILTTFVLFNNTRNEVDVSLQVRDNPGQPLPITLVGEGTGSEFEFTLQPGETRFLRTEDDIQVTEGSAVLRSTAPIGVSAIFSILNRSGQFLTESGISAAKAFTQASLAVDVRGQFNTGVALQNLEDAPVVVTFDLLDTGGFHTLQSTTRQLQPNGHLGVFAGGPGGLFNISNFQGRLLISSPTPLAAQTLRQNLQPLSFTTLPVITDDSAETEILLPQIANGANAIKTTFVLYSLSSAPTTVDLRLTDDDGNPYPVRFEGGAEGHQIFFQIPARGTLFARTDGSGPLKAGAARLVSDQPFAAAAIFTILDPWGNPATETGVASSPALRTFSLPVDMTGGLDTGVAFFNSGLTGSELLLTFMPEGIRPQADPETEVVLLQPRAHIARFVSEFFAPGRRGMLAVRAGNPVSALTLRQNLTPLSFTTLPVSGGTPDDEHDVTGILAATRTGVDVTTDRVLDQTLEIGFRISGRLNTANPFDFIFEVSAVSEDGRVYPGSLDDADSYLVIVPRGTYTLRFCYVSGNFVPATPTISLGSTNISHRVTGVSVQSDVVRNVDFPQVTLRSVSGRLTNLDTLPPSLSGHSIFLTLTSANALTSAIAFVDEDGSFSASLANGSYTASLIFSEDEEEVLSRLAAQGITAGGTAAQLYNLGQFTVNGPVSGINLAVPRLVRLSGRVSQPQRPVLPEFTAVNAFDATVPEGVSHACMPEGGFSIAPVAPNGPYETLLVRSRLYDIFAGLPVTSLGTDEEGTLIVPGRRRNLLQLEADSNLNFNFPPLPAERTLSGQLRTALGTPLSEVIVSVFSENLTGTPDATFIASTRTDGQGRYSLTVLSGTEYRVEFIPTPDSLIAASSR